MGAGLILFILLLGLALTFYVLRGINAGSSAREKSDDFYRNSLQIYVDMHKMKKQNRTISLDASYDKLVSGNYQTLVTLMSKLGGRGQSFQGHVLFKDWLIRRICVGGVDISSVPPEEGKALLKASLDFLKFRDFRVECMEGRRGVWNIKGFYDSDRSNSMNMINIYLSEAQPVQASENNAGRNLKGNVVSSDSQQHPGSRPGVAEVNRAERVAMLLRPGPEVIANLVRAIQEHIQRREAYAASFENQCLPSDVSDITELQEVAEEIVMPLRSAPELATNLVCTLQEHIQQRETHDTSSENQYPSSDRSDAGELQEVVPEVATEKSGGICVNLLDSSSELVVSIPAISVFEAIQIMDERKKRGYYAGLDDMKKRLDIDPVRLDTLAEHICFQLPTMES